MIGARIAATAGLLKEGSSRHLRPKRHPSTTSRNEGLRCLQNSSSPRYA